MSKFTPPIKANALKKRLTEAFENVVAGIINDDPDNFFDTTVARAEETYTGAREDGNSAKEAKAAAIEEFITELRTYIDENVATELDDIFDNLKP